MADEITVTISADRLKATISTIAANTKPEDIMQLLTESGVTSGIQSTAILGAIDEAKKSGKALTDVVIAEGSTPKPKVPPKIEHQIAGEPADLPPLRELVPLLELENPREVATKVRDVEVLTVHGGDLLAIQHLGEVTPGIDVTGKEVLELGDDALPPHFEPGSGVELTNAGEYKAKYPGFAGLFDGKVSVLPPVWVAPDGMLAAYMNAPRLPGSVPFTAEDIETALKGADVEEGINSEAIQELCAGMESGEATKPLVAVAYGKRPVEPTDAEAEFQFDYETQAGAVQKDGSIDLRERQMFPSVGEEEVLVTCQPPKEGVSGLTVRGEEVEVRKPARVDLVAGDQVESLPEGDVQKLISKINGGASVQLSETTVDEQTVKTYTLSVREIAQVPGNVDYETGNIDFKGNVEIKGGVVTGFKVKATGDIVIGENVEDGVEITTDGDLTVKQGIVGERTEIRVGGNVKAKFIQDCTVYAGGNVEAEVYLRTADVRAEDGVIVRGKGATGGILGGKTYAMKSVVANNVGAEGNQTTLVSLGVLPDTMEEFKRLRTELDKARDSKQALLEAMGIEALKKEDIQQALVNNPRKQKQIMEYVAKANEQAKIESECTAELNAIGAKMKGGAATAKLDVTNTAHRRVRIRIGSADKTLDADVQAVRFHLERDGSNGIAWTALTEADKAPAEETAQKEA